MKYSLTCHQTITELENIKKNWPVLDDRHEIPKIVEADIDYLKFQISEGLLTGAPLICLLNKEKSPYLLSIGVVKTVEISPSIAYYKLHFIKLKKKCYYIFPYSIFGEIDSEVEFQNILSTIIPSLKNNDIDYIFFSLLPQESNLGKSILKIRNPLIGDPVPVFTDHYILKVPENLESYLASKDSKSRGKLRRIIRRLENEYENSIDIKVYTDERQIDQFFEHAEAIMEKSHLRPLKIGFKDTEEEKKKKRWLAENGFFRSYILYLNGKPISFIVGINYKHHFFAEHIGFDMEYEKLRVGTYLRLKVIEDIAQTKCAEIIDYGHGSDEYKQNFSSKKINSIRIKIYKPKFSHVFFIAFQVFFSFLNKGGRLLLQKTNIYNKVRKTARTILMKKGM